jgi:hypothetical protein
VNSRTRGIRHFKVKVLKHVGRAEHSGFDDDDDDNDDDVSKC